MLAFAFGTVLMFKSYQEKTQIQVFSCFYTVKVLIFTVLSHSKIDIFGFRMAGQAKQHITNQKLRS